MILYLKAAKVLTTNALQLQHIAHQNLIPIIEDNNQPTGLLCK